MKSFGTSRDIQKRASTSAVRLKVPDNTVEKDPAYYLFTTQQSSDLPSTQADFALLIYYQQRPLHQRNSPNLPSQNSTEMEQQMTPHYIKGVLAASLQYLQSAIYIFYSLLKKLLTGYIAHGGAVKIELITTRQECLLIIPLQDGHIRPVSLFVFHIHFL